MPFLSQTVRYPRLLLRGLVLATSLTLPLAAAAQQRQSQTVNTINPIGAQMTPLAESIHPAVARATKLHRLAANQPVNATVCFQFNDPQAAQDYADAVSDPNSLLYGQWLTPQELGQRFGPSNADYAALLQYCQANGLQIVWTPVQRMVVTVSGTAAQMEKAFGVKLNVYKEAAADAALRGPDGVAYEFVSSETPVQVPAELAGKITSVEGLDTYARPIPRRSKLKHTVSGPFNAVVARNAYDLSTIYNILNATASNKPGTGRTIGISNWDGTNPGTGTSGNALNFINRNSLPFPTAGKVSNIQRVIAGTSSGTSGQGEGDLDYQMALGQAPLATIIIYDDTGTAGPITVLNKEISDNKADVISESYGWNLSGSTLTSCHNAHVSMTTLGITYLAASGDSGNIANSVYQYPDYDPEVLNIGGTTLVANNSPAYTWFSETGWSGSGGGTSTSTATFNKLPAWQKGRNVPVTNKRNVPDIASHSAASAGAYYFYYASSLNAADGTSFASPVNAGDFAVVEQYMISLGGLPANGAGKQRLGRVADKLYAFNGRNDIYHDITSGNNGFAAAKYWDYVTGWGSVDWSNLATALLNPLAVTVTSARSDILQGQTVSLTATVTGSNVTTVIWSVSSGPGTVSATGLYTAPASVSSVQTVTVKATSTLDTANPGTTGTAVQPNPVFGTATVIVRPITSVSGTVQLDGIADPAETVIPVNPVTFILTPTAGGAPITVSQTLGAGGTFSLSSIPGNTYNLSVKGDKWLRAVQTVDTSNGSVFGLTFSLTGGDSNNDNSLDIADFNIFLTAYGKIYDVSNPGSGYDPTADFNNDGIVDLGDFGILVNNFGAVGQ